MSRHRNVRTMDYNDGKNNEIYLELILIIKFFGLAVEYDGYDDVYGRSVDDDHTSMSPSDAQQWIYDRNRQRNVSAFMGVEEENDEYDEASGGHSRQRLMSEVNIC